MKATTNHIQYDVIISGGGPVGLFLACELALAKCSVLVLEKAADPNSPLKQLPFGMRGLNAPSVEALDRRDLLKELDIHKYLKNPHKTNITEGSKRQVGHFAGIPFLEGHIDTSKFVYRLPGSTPVNLISTIGELETVFAQRAETLGVEILRGRDVIGIHQTSDKVIVETAESSFTGKWLVGCDGARSMVRKAGDFEFAGTEPAFTGYTTSIDIADPEKLKPGRNLTSAGMYLQSQPGYVIIQDFDSGAFHNSGKPITAEHVQEVLRRVSGTDVTVTALHAATTWTDRARQATSYRKGHVFLAGDASHIHSPLGGQGLNLGLGDAMNLGWKLAAVIHGKAPDGLLDTYHAERSPVSMQVLDWSRAQVAIMNPDPGARAINAIIRDLMETTDGATYFASRVWGVNIRYDLGADHPLIGRSVPNFELVDGSLINNLMYDGKGLLIDFMRNDQLKITAAPYAGQLKYIAGPAKDQLGLTALLVRPDGIVAWVNEAELPAGGFQQALMKWFTPL